MVPDKNREMGWLFAKDIGECMSSQMTSRIKELFNWAACEREAKRAVKIQAITGVACPYVWSNELEPSFSDMLKSGVYYEHIFGPVIATLRGRSVLMDLQARFPQTMDFRVLYNRSPKHCLIASSSADKAEDTRFRMMIEAPHGLVDRTFHLGEIQLLEKTDPEILEKMWIYLQKQEDIGALGMETERAFNLGDLTMEYEDIVRAYSTMRANKKYSDILNAEDLLRYANSA